MGLKLRMKLHQHKITLDNCFVLVFCSSCFIKKTFFGVFGRNNLNRLQVCLVVNFLLKQFKIKFVELFSKITPSIIKIDPGTPFFGVLFCNQFLASRKEGYSIAD